MESTTVTDLKIMIMNLKVFAEQGFKQNKTGDAIVCERRRFAYQLAWQKNWDEEELPFYIAEIIRYRNGKRVDFTKTQREYLRSKDWFFWNEAETRFRFQIPDEIFF